MTIQSVTQFMEIVRARANGEELPEDTHNEVAEYLTEVTKVGHDKLDTLFPPHNNDFGVFSSTIAMMVGMYNPVAFIALSVDKDLLTLILQYIVGVAQQEGWFKEEF